MRKKTLAIFITLVVCMCSCTSTKTIFLTTTINGGQNTNLVPTVTITETVTVSGNPTISTTSTTNTSRQYNSEQYGGKWTLKQYIDEFERPSNVNYITNGVKYLGRESLGYSIGHEIWIWFVVDSNMVRMKITNSYYGEQLKNNTDKTIAYTMTILDPNGNKTTESAIMLEHSIYLYLGDANSKIMKALLNYEEFSIRLENRNNPNEVYLMDINPDNFKEMYKLL